MPARLFMNSMRSRRRHPQAADSLDRIGEVHPILHFRQASLSVLLRITILILFRDRAKTIDGDDDVLLGWGFSSSARSGSSASSNLFHHKGETGDDAEGDFFNVGIANTPEPGESARGGSAGDTGSGLVPGVAEATGASRESFAFTAPSIDTNCLLIQTVAPRGGLIFRKPSGFLPRTCTTSPLVSIVCTVYLFSLSNDPANAHVIAVDCPALTIRGVHIIAGNEAERTVGRKYLVPFTSFGHDREAIPGVQLADRIMVQTVAASDVDIVSGHGPRLFGVPRCGIFRDRPGVRFRRLRWRGNLGRLALGKQWTGGSPTQSYSTKPHG